MIDSILNFIFPFQWTSWPGILLYWIPLVICLIGYSIKTIKQYLKDKKVRETPGTYYIPSLTIGTVLARILATVLPTINLIAAIFDIVPKLSSQLFLLVDDLFCYPLVPDSSRYINIRERKNEKGGEK